MSPPAQNLDASRCALIVVDVQNDFFHGRGAVAQMGLDVEPVRAIMPRLHRAIELARSIGVPRIFLRGEHSHWFNTEPWLERGREGSSLDVRQVPVVEAGTWGAEFYEVEPRDDELVVTKHRYSGFAYTPLELVLQAKRCETVVLIGTATNVCVEATARDALMRGYRPVVVSDCVASGLARLHDAALEDMAQYLGAVVTLDDLARAWRTTAHLASQT